MSEATGFVEASGDAALVWQASFACREPTNGPVFGTQMVVLENIDEAKQPTRDEFGARMKEKATLTGSSVARASPSLFPAAASRR